MPVKPLKLQSTFKISFFSAALIGLNDKEIKINKDNDFYIQGICGLGDTSSWAGPYLFTTPCVAIVPPNLEDFSGGFPPNACWDQAGDGDPSSGPTNLGTSSWFEDGFGNVGFTGAVKVNLYLANKNE